MASSTRAAPRQWIPGLPDNEADVMETMRAYRDGLALLKVPELMAELTRINAAIQSQGQAALAAVLTQRLSETIGSLDSVTLRSRPTASPSSDSGKGRAGQASPTSLPPAPWLPRSRSSGLGRAAAERIAAAAARRQAEK